MLIKKLSQQWLDTVKEKNSLICAGLDPALFAMGRGEKGLPEHIQTNEHLYERCLGYLDAVAPYVSGLKYNVKYREGEGQVEVIKRLVAHARVLGLFIIEDGKVADIGSTNDAAWYYAAQRGAQSVTLAPYAGNMTASIADAEKRGLGVFTMCLMSNPEYEDEKNIAVSIDPKDFATEDVGEAYDKYRVDRYIALAQQAQRSNALGVVIGAPGEHNHISDYELDRVAHYLGEEQLILSPGTGAQGGSPKALIERFGDRVIVAMSRGLMFPEGSSSAPEQQAVAAKHRQEHTNSFRS